MGVDIYGTVNEDRLNDRHEDGKEAPYFRSNWWYWRPLWDFLYEHAGDILTAREHELGHYNCGPLLDSDKTRAIAKRLRSLITDGSVGNQEALAHADQAMTEEVPCVYCEGTGTRKDMIVENGCNACQGNGKIKPMTSWHTFSSKTVEDFCQFLEKSEGVTIY